MSASATFKVYLGFKYRRTLNATWITSGTVTSLVGIGILADAAPDVFHAVGLEPRVESDH